MFEQWLKFLISYLMTSDRVLKGFGAAICTNPCLDLSVRCEAGLIDKHFHFQQIVKKIYGGTQRTGVHKYLLKHTRDMF